MKVFAKKIYLAILAFGLLAGFSVFEYGAILQNNCFWQKNWLFCKENISKWQEIFLVIAIALCFGILIYFGRNLWKIYSENNFNKRQIFAYIFAFILLAFLLVPFGSGDMNYYYNAGRALNSGVNVYKEIWPFKNELTPASPQITMVYFSYGPLAALLFSLVFKIGANIFSFVVAWKFFVVLSFVSCAFMLNRIIILNDLVVNREKFYLFWFLQPLLLFEWISNGHFDAVWLLFVLTALFFAQKKKWFLSVAGLVIGVWIKFIPVFIAPWLVLWWWQEADFKNWRKQVGVLAMLICVAIALTFFVWAPYWAGFGTLKSIVYQSKWVVSSYFGILYYSLLPIFTSVFGGGAHWYLTRLVHLVLALVAIYFLYPYFKNVLLVLTKKLRWEVFEYYQAIFVTLFIYLFIWQKSFWPWYAAWLLPFGLLVYFKYNNIFLKKILIWISLVPLIFYPIWILVLKSLGVYAETELWFNYLYVLAVSLYPLINLYKWRKTGYSLI